MKKYLLLSLAVLFSLYASFVLANYGIQTKTKNCIANQILQDSACTPGAVLTTNTAVICKTGYTKTVRDVSESTKKKVFAEYGIPYSQHSNYEVDHLISLELGGGNDISNLWPENSKITSGSLTKDKFENYLHTQVCAGKMTITEAQKEISNDWLKYYSAEIKPAKTTQTTVAPTGTTTTSQAVNSATSAGNKSQPEVKKSSTGICHEKGTTYYNETKNFTPYNSIADCLASGGRLPKK